MNDRTLPAPSRQCALVTSLWRLIPLLWLLFFVVPASRAEPVHLDRHWEYRWGDSPFQDGTPLWTRGTDATAWRRIDFPSNPPGRDRHENVWYRTQIPNGDWHDPVLYIFSVDLIVEVYLEGQRIYQYGEFDTRGRGQFQGWPWHMIPLPPDAVGKPLYFRIFSNYMDIGLWGEVKVMEREALYQQIMRQSIGSLFITVFSLLIAVLALLFALLTRERRNLTALGLFALASAGLALSTTPAKQLLLHQPILWDYLEAGSYFMLPVALALLLQRWFNRQRQLFRVLRKTFMLYFVGALSLALMGVVSLADTFPVFDILFALLVPAMLLAALRQLPRASIDQRVMLGATALLTLLLMLDMAVAHSWIPWSRIPVGWGSLAFSLAMVMLSLRHVHRAQRAAERAWMLEFDNHKHHLLDEIVHELEQQQTLDAVTERLVDRLPGLCAPLSGALYRKEEPFWRLQQYWGPVQGLVGTASAGNLRLPDRHWRQFPIHYDDPRRGRREIALLALEFDPSTTDIETLDPAPLQTLFMRAVERINLSLSKLVQQQALSRFSYEDGLTGLHNRRYLDEMLSREIALAQRNRAPLALMICDLDHFKRLNDSHGHAAGDEVLKLLARTLHSIFRETDIICRYGGEEFVVVMPGADCETCYAKTERLRTALGTQVVHYQDQTIGPVTLSAGIAELTEDDTSADELFKQADDALYRAKAEGRNQVVCMEAPDAAQYPCSASPADR